jgi:hypothetical protein
MLEIVRGMRNATFDIHQARQGLREGARAIPAHAQGFGVGGTA